MAENYLSTEEAAAILGVTSARVRQFIDAGRLPNIRIGRMYVLPESAVRSLRRGTPGQPPKETT